jgi:ribonucleotide monophosphatase NagD (HAD superfamily)
VGDSVEHDIAGAKGAGISAVLVRSGILSDMGAHDLEGLYRRYGAVPDFLLPRFAWEESAG